MVLPKFLIGDNTDFPDDIFIVHTEYPQFILNLANDDIEWLEEVKADAETDLTGEINDLIEQAYNFYDRETRRYEE